MKRILLLFLLLLAGKVSVFGSHIVGGEFELLHESGFEYTLNMILYFDEINGNPGAKDPSVTVYVWRKSDNSLIRSFTLDMVEDIFVPYSNTDCDDGQLITSRILYSSRISLPASDFSDPEGYYISWERCCRNYTITNILSDDPAAGSGIAAGQTFYLEFPPVTRGGQPFINSTPRLFPPLRDYGCVGNFYFVDFGGIDDDGDSLVYSLVTPYSTIEPTAIPASPNPGPYPDVVWQDGFDLDHVMGGTPDLAISRKGLLTVTPSSIGLYVFAVKCEEYREGEKIGEMRRDFQMLVVSNCSNNDPIVRAREQGKSNFYNEGQVLNFDYSDPDKCIDILVTDEPVIGEDEENVTVRAIPINFDAELEGIDISFDNNVPITSKLDTARFTVCFPDCPFTRNGFYQIGIIGYDDACPQPALDTVIVSLNVPPPPNQLAYFANAKGDVGFSKLTESVTETSNGSVSVPIRAFDDDDDDLELTIEPQGFDLATVGMSFSDINYSPGQAITTLNWNYDCNAEDLDLSAGRDVSSGGVIKKAFDILITAEDLDDCEWEDPQTLLVTLIIDFPNQTKPRVYRQGQPGVDSLYITHTIGEVLNIPVNADDADNDQIRLQGGGLDFDFQTLGATFEEKQGVGVPGITSMFSLPVACQFDLNERDTLTMLFLTEDFDACQLTNEDSLLVQVHLVPPVNTAPRLSFNSLNTLKVKDDTLNLMLGEQIEGRLSGFDIDNDSIQLLLTHVEPAIEGFEFEDGAGKGQLTIPFNWTPDCAVFTDDTYKVNYTFTFSLYDNNCYAPKSDSLSLVVHIEDVESNQNAFQPPNFFSPNGDEYNQFFGPYALSEETKTLVNVLPVDNCAGVFQGVYIYNRWGKTVFESKNRDFKWFGNDEPPGVYYYMVKYSNREYKGWVTMMK